MKRIIYTRPDGGVSVVVPAPDFVAEFKTEADALAVIQSGVQASATNVAVCDAADIPADRMFRNAWRRSIAGPPMISIDMPAARAIHALRINEAVRAKAGDLINREAMGEDVTTEKIALRDINVQQQINVAKTPEELAVIWPAQLI